MIVGHSEQSYHGGDSDTFKKEQIGPNQAAGSVKGMYQ
jgi:hypothetical protein